MGIEPTCDPYGPHAGFEDQGHHQGPITSKHEFQRLIDAFRQLGNLFFVGNTPVHNRYIPLGGMQAIAMENVMANSKATKPKKPRPDFPLFPHPSGYWAKRSRAASATSTRWPTILKAMRH